MLDNELIQKAEQNDIDALIKLGAAYENGEDGDENRAKAFPLFQKVLALDPQNAVALDKIAICYSHGIGVEVDKEKAAQLYRQAAELGNHAAQFHLAFHLEGKKDPECIVWYEKAYAGGYEDALTSLALIYLLGKIVKKDLDLAKKWATLGETIPACQYILAFIYLEEDADKSAFWAQKALENGQEDAQELLSLALQKKDLDRQEAQRNSSRNSSQKSGGCYVATAVYGSYDCPEVWTLRRFRDYTLAETWHGRLFIKFYYAISPTLVKWFGNTTWFKNLWKPTLDKMVKKLNSNGVQSTPYEDKKY